MVMKMSNAFIAMIAAGMGALDGGAGLGMPKIKLFSAGKLNNRSKYIPAGVNRNVQDNVIKRYRNKAA